MLRVGVVLVLATLAGCASERGFRPFDADDETDDPSVDPGDDPDDPDGPGGGGWGDWDLGSLPNIALVLAVQPGAIRGGNTELLVTDVRGQVIDRWEPPTDELGLGRKITSVQPLGEGRVLVVTERIWDFDKTTFDNAGERTTFDDEVVFLGSWDLGNRADAIWIGDLTTRSWTRVVHLEDDLSHLVVDATGQTIPFSAFTSLWKTHIASHGYGSDRLLLSWHTALCRPIDGQRVLSLPLDSTGEARMWRLDESWPSFDDPLVEALIGGETLDGEPVALGVVVEGPCAQSSEQLPARSLVHWWLDGGSRVIAEDLDPNDQVAFEPRSAAAVIVSEGPVDSEERQWNVRWVGAPDGLDVQVTHPGGVRVLAALDAEHGASLVALQDQIEGDELVFLAGAKDVWHIDALKEGLSKRDIYLIDGTVVLVPE